MIIYQSRDKINTGLAGRIFRDNFSRADLLANSQKAYDATKDSKPESINPTAPMLQGL